MPSPRPPSCLRARPDRLLSWLPRCPPSMGIVDCRAGLPVRNLKGSSFVGATRRRGTSRSACRVSKFEGGNHEQIDPQQALSQHDTVARNVGSEDYEQIAHEAFSRLSPEQRTQLGETLVQQ